MQNKVAEITITDKGIFEVKEFRGRIYTASRIKDLRNLIGDMAEARKQELKKAKMTKQYGNDKVLFEFEAVDWYSYVEDGFVSPRDEELVLNVDEGITCNGFDEITVKGTEKEVYAFFKRHLNPFMDCVDTPEKDIRAHFELFRVDELQG